jgi:hypothetical protein
MEPRGNEDGCGYCKRLRQKGQWGSAAEILALSRVLGRAISVHERERPSGTSLKLVAKYGEDTRKGGKEALRLLYVGNAHYMAIVQEGRLSQQSYEGNEWADDFLQTAPKSKL